MLNFTRVKSLAIIVVLLSIIPEAFAFKAPPSREELLFMDIPMVYTATKTSTPASKAPATVVVVSRGQIKDRGYNNLLDLMKDLPGVDVQDRTGQEMYNYVAIRGIIKQNKFLILQDGHRISSSTGESIPIAENFPLHNTKQVEVVYGPASALYGADAFAGVINIITRDAEDVGGWEASVSAGNLGYQNHMLSYGDRISNNITLSAGGHWHEADNANLPKYYDEYKLSAISWDHDNNGATPNVLVAAGDRKFDVPTESHSAYLRLDINEAFTLGYNRSFFRHPSAQGALPDQVFWTEDAKWETLINNYYVDYRFDEGDDLSGKTSVSYSTYEVLPGSKFIDAWNGYQDVAYKYANTSRFKFEQQIDIELNENNKAVTGIVFEQFDALPKTANLTHPYDEDLASAEQGYFYAGSNGTIPLNIYEFSYKNYGAYFQLQTELTSKLSTTIGVRLDDNSRYGSTVNPRGGLVYNPREETTMKLLYGEAYWAPSPYISYTNYGTFGADTDADGLLEGANFRMPNPNLKPEKLKTIETSIVEEISPSTKVAASLFYTEIEDLIQSVTYNTNNLEIAGGEISPWKRYENKSESYFWGGELSAEGTTEFNSIDLKFWGNYSYLRGLEENTNGVKTEHPSIAKHKLKLGITATVDKFYFSPSLRWIGQTNNQRITDPSKDKQHVPSYKVVDLNMGVNEVMQGLSVAINIKNLMDKRYYNGGGGGATLQSSPQEPRRIVLSLNYKF